MENPMKIVYFAGTTTSNLSHHPAFFFNPHITGKSFIPYITVIYPKFVPMDCPMDSSFGVEAQASVMPRKRLWSYATSTKVMKRRAASSSSMGLEPEKKFVGEKNVGFLWEGWFLAKWNNIWPT